MAASDNPRIGTVYLIHFHSELSEVNHCQHYIGWAKNPADRFSEHLSGRGARLTQVAVERGVQFTIVRTWSGVDRNFERTLKNRKNGRKLCPVCNGKMEVYDLPEHDALDDDVTF